MEICHMFSIGWRKAKSGRKADLTTRSLHPVWWPFSQTQRAQFRNFFSQIRHSELPDVFLISETGQVEQKRALKVVPSVRRSCSWLTWESISFSTQEVDGRRRDSFLLEKDGDRREAWLISSVGTDDLRSYSLQKMWGKLKVYGGRGDKQKCYKAFFSQVPFLMISASFSRRNIWDLFHMA